jgi:hypothetical protein
VIIGTANFLDMAKGTVVMMLLFVSVVYEKAVNPIELTAGQTSSTLAINSNGRESHGRWGAITQSLQVASSILGG